MRSLCEEKLMKSPSLASLEYNKITKKKSQSQDFLQSG